MGRARALIECSRVHRESSFRASLKNREELFDRLLQYSTFPHMKTLQLHLIPHSHDLDMSDEWKVLCTLNYDGSGSV